MTDERREKAIETIEKSKQTHIEWLAFFEKNPVLQGSTEYKHLGDIEHHKKCIEEYNQVISLLEPPPCETCGGSGKIPTFKAFMAETKPCPNCKGTGKQPDHKPKHREFTASPYIKKILDEAKPDRQPSAGEKKVSNKCGECEDYYCCKSDAKLRGKYLPKNKKACKKFKPSLEYLQALLTDRDKTIAERAEALNPIREWYGGGTEGNRSDLQILTDVIADLQKDRARVLEQAEEIKDLK